MKKKRLFFLVLLVLCISLTGCGKDKIIGKWKHKKINQYYVFEKDNKGYFEIASQKLEFKYKKDDKEITFIFEKPKSEVKYMYTINDKELILEDSYGNKDTYIKQ